MFAGPAKFGKTRSGRGAAGRGFTSRKNQNRGPGPLALFGRRLQNLDWEPVPRPHRQARRPPNRQKGPFAWAGTGGGDWNPCFFAPIFPKGPPGGRWPLEKTGPRAGACAAPGLGRPSPAGGPFFFGAPLAAWAAKKGLLQLIDGSVAAPISRGAPPGEKACKGRGLPGFPWAVLKPLKSRRKGPKAWVTGPRGRPGPADFSASCSGTGLKMGGGNLAEKKTARGYV